MHLGRPIYQLAFPLVKRLNQQVVKEMKMSIIKQIEDAVKNRKLTEPFGKKDLERAFDWPKGTNNAYLWKHYVGNPGGKKEYFEKVALGKFRLKS